MKQSWGFVELQSSVAGVWGEGSVHLHALVQTCAESSVAHLVRSTGTQEMEGKMSGLVAQYCRLLSTCTVRAQAQCLLSRVSAISGAARGAAERRAVTARLESRLEGEREAQWMASFSCPGWARRGRCHRL